MVTGHRSCGDASFCEHLCCRAAQLRGLALTQTVTCTQETESEDGETLDVTSMPEVTLLLPKAISLGLPCPELLQPKQPGGKGNSASGKGNNPGGCFFTRQLPAILATGGILTLMVVSVIALWPAAPMELQRSPAARDSQPSLPRKFLDKCGASSTPVLILMS